MKQKTLLLFQFLLIIFAFYSLLEFSDNQQLFVPLVCFVTAFIVGKVEISLTERSKQEKDQNDDVNKQGEVETTVQALDCLLKSKNVMFLIDAIQHLLRDLDLVVSPSPNHPAINRLVKIPGMQVIFGLIIISDVAELDENWDKWEELDGFDLGKGGKRRLLIVGSNCIEETGNRPQRYKKFSVNTQKLLSAKQITAMTTLTLNTIYDLCKTNKPNIKKVFHHIQHRSGGIFELKSSS